MKRLLTNLLLATAAFVLALGLSWLLLSLLDIDVSRRIAIARARLSPATEGIGIYRQDPRLGWDHIPGSAGRHLREEFDVWYSIDARGHRTTGGGTGPPIYFLGGSFTFGYGVEDGEHFPALLQRRFPDFDVANAAVIAWGPTQAYFRLQDLLASDHDASLFAYGFITHHMQRTFLREDWLSRLDEYGGKRNPYFRLVNGQLIFQGLADPGDRPRRNERLGRIEAELTAALISEMQRLCDEHGVPFRFLYFSDAPRFETLPPVVRGAIRADSIVDIGRAVREAGAGYNRRGHPGPATHELIADVLQPVVEAAVQHPVP